MSRMGGIIVCFVEVKMMMDEERKRRVPDFCPFCFTDGKAWTEFVVGVTEFCIMDGGVEKRALLEQGVTVRCTRCAEVIEEDDLRGAPKMVDDYLEDAYDRARDDGEELPDGEKRDGVC